MTVSRIMEMTALGVLVAGVAFGGYLFEFHLGDYEQTKAEVMYLKCKRTCIQTCAVNGIREADCNCEHCREMLE